MIKEFIGENGARRVRLFSGVKGLVSHGDELKSLLSVMNPEIILVTISPAEVEGLTAFLKDPFEMNLSDYEIIYGIRLRKYGEVMTPPPIYVEAVSYSSRQEGSIVGIDMDDESYSKAYTDNVGAFDLVRDSIRKKRVLNADYHDSNEYEFSEAWAERQRKPAGRRRLEEARQKYINGKISEFLENGYRANHLIVSDHEFFRGIVATLKQMGYREIEENPNP